VAIGIGISVSGGILDAIQRPAFQWFNFLSLIFSSATLGMWTLVAASSRSISHRPARMAFFLGLVLVPIIPLLADAVNRQRGDVEVGATYYPVIGASLVLALSAAWLVRPGPRSLVGAILFRSLAVAFGLYGIIGFFALLLAPDPGSQESSEVTWLVAIGNLVFGIGFLAVSFFFHRKGAKGARSAPMPHEPTFVAFAASRR
jgi:hypothetical protein